MFTRIFPRGESKSVVIRGVDLELKQYNGKYECPTAGHIQLSMKCDLSKTFYDSPHGRFVIDWRDAVIQALVSAGF